MKSITEQSVAEPQIVEGQDRLLIGMRIQTSLSENRTFELWHQFKPRAKEIASGKHAAFFSVQHYPIDLKFEEFTHHTIFEKWAAVQVEDFEKVPAGMETLRIPSGKFAVFIHAGLASEAYKTMQYIFGHWLPKSAYALDNRPQFEIMSAHYLPTDPNAEEEVWVPIKSKN